MSTLQPLFTALESILSEHERLIELGQRKREVLVQNNVTELNAITKEEVASVHRLQRLEGERVGVSRLLAVRFGIPDTQFTAKALATRLDKDEAERWSSLTDRLRGKLDELKRLNDLNRQLIEQSLMLLENTVGLLTESPVVPTYGGSGQTHNPYQTGRTSVFDSKA